MLRACSFVSMHVMSYIDHMFIGQTDRGLHSYALFHIYISGYRNLTTVKISPLSRLAGSLLLYTNNMHFNVSSVFRTNAFEWEPRAVTSQKYGVVVLISLCKTVAVTPFHYFRCSCFSRRSTCLAHQDYAFNRRLWMSRMSRPRVCARPSTPRF